MFYTPERGEAQRRARLDQRQVEANIWRYSLFGKIHFSEKSLTHKERQPERYEPSKADLKVNEATREAENRPEIIQASRDKRAVSLLKIEWNASLLTVLLIWSEVLLPL